MHCRSLPSFPTRRSSDLTFHQSDFLQNWLGSRERFDLIVSNPPYIAHEEREDLSDTVKNFDPELALLDRKSTRLNSSHVAISYAVFCLKKKTQFDSALSN